MACRPGHRQQSQCRPGPARDPDPVDPPFGDAVAFVVPEIPAAGPERPAQGPEDGLIDRELVVVALDKVNQLIVPG